VAAQQPGVVKSILRVQELADYIVPFAIRAVCDLGVADHLAEGPRPVEELAAATGAHAPSLHRTLRALACKGIFAEVEPGSFALTPLAELLRSDHPLSLRDAYPLLPADVTAWAHFDHTVETGEPAFDRVHGRPYYDYLADHPDESRRFDGSVHAQNRLVLRTVLSAYDWGGLGTIVDVAGGDGAFLARLLARHPPLRGVLFDLPHVVARAPAVLERAGVADRCEVVSGSFFDGVPEGGDTYLLKTILHDWDDEAAEAILANVRAAAGRDARLILLEALLEQGDDFHIGKLLDLHSLVLVGGPDRSRDDFERLLARTGFELTGVTSTATLAIMEARPVKVAERRLVHA
jgi:hypothetical protein